MIPTYKSFSIRIQLILFSSWISFHNCSFEAQMDSTEINNLFITIQINCFHLKSSHVNICLTPKSDLNLNNLSLIPTFNLSAGLRLPLIWFSNELFLNIISLSYCWATYKWFLPTNHSQLEFNWFYSHLEYHSTIVLLKPKWIPLKSIVFS